MRLLLGSTVAILLAVGALADDKPEKIDAKKLIGKWGTTPANPGKLVIEFAKDGKVVFSPQGSSEIEGTYKVNDDKITIAIKDKQVTYSISKLTDTEMIFKNDQGKEQALSRIKEQ